MSNVFTPPQEAIGIVTFTDIEREAMEALPLKQAMRSLLRQLEDELNAQLKAAIEAQLGHELTDPEILRGRLTNVTVEGEKGTTYCLDTVPLLWVGEAAITREGDTLTAKRDIRQLVGENAGERPR